MIIRMFQISLYSPFSQYFTDRSACFFLVSFNIFFIVVSFVKSEVFVGDHWPASGRRTILQRGAVVRVVPRTAQVGSPAFGGSLVARGKTPRSLLG